MAGKNKGDKAGEILRALEKRSGTGVEWSMTAREETQNQLFHAGAEAEAIRTVDDVSFEVEIHHHHFAASRPAMGIVRFYALLSDSPAEIGEKISWAVSAASKLDSREWFFPGPGLRYPRVKAFAASEAGHPRETLDSAADEILAAADRESGVEVSHFEIVLAAAMTRMFNSAGLRLSGKTSSAVLHLVLVARQGGAAFDIKRELYRRSAADFRLAAEVAEASGFARDTLSASLPSSGTMPVVISHSGLDFLFSPVLAHAGGEFHFEKLSRFKTGEEILDGRIGGDALTLSSDGLLPMGVLTAPFTSEGLPPSRTEVVKEGVFRNVVAASEFASALGIPPTGPFSNVVVGSGSAAFGDMISGPRLLHVVEFSAMLPDRVAGGFTAEIRLGYEIRGRESRPVKGGAVSGNLFDAMRRMTLSKETCFRGDYSGAAAVRFEDLSVSGA